MPAPPNINLSERIDLIINGYVEIFDMKIQYITTDFEFESTENLHPIVKEIGDELFCRQDQWEDEIYRVSFSGTGSEIYNEPEQTINEFCSLIERLSEKSKKLWNGCKKRVADIAFESGNESNHLTCNLTDSLISRLNDLSIGIAITIYPIGTYASRNNEI